MHYLKCQKCGRFNEVKTEYLTFCQHCGAKLDNNYRSWKAKNGEKSFLDFKREACHSSDQMEKLQNSVPKNSPKRNWGIVLGVLIGAAIIIGGGKFAKDYLVASLTQTNFATAIQSNWKIQPCGDLGLSLESPIVLKSQNTLSAQIPDNIKAMIVKLENFVGETPDHRLYIMANSAKYVPDVQVSLQGAVQGSLQQLQARQEVSNFTYEESDITNSGVTGKLITGQWLEGEKQVGFYQAIFTQANNTWQILVGFDKSDENGKTIAERIIQSVKINA